MILFFDTETNGLPKNSRGDIHDVDNWPRIIQLAWTCFSFDGKLLESRCHLIRPLGWTIPNEPFWINNGFSTEKSLECGIDIQTALSELALDMEVADTLIAHNLGFDRPIVAAEMLRVGIRINNKPNKICTMQTTTNLCRIPSRSGGYKWPKLEELHRFLFNCDFEGAHDALNDVMATAKCYFELRNRGHVTSDNKVPEKPTPVQRQSFNINDL